MALAHRLSSRDIQYLDRQSALLLVGIFDSSTTDLLGYLKMSTAHSKRCLASEVSESSSTRLLHSRPTFKTTSTRKQMTSKHHPKESEATRTGALYCEVDAESLERYRKGGYHPTHMGDTFEDGRYKVIHKLGWGGYATVWLARDFM